MKTIEPSIRVLAASDHEPPEVPFSYTTEPELLIEFAGRTCYNSRDKIAPGSAKPFMERLKAKGHLSVLEHSWYVVEEVFDNTRHPGYVANIRAIQENNDKFYYNPWEKAATFHVVCDRGVSHEFVRHRSLSFSQKSTRYVTEKPGEMEFIRPPWITGGFIDQGWKTHLEDVEKMYRDLIDFGWRPEQARSVLPNSLATELVVTGPLSAWQHFCKLRCDKAAHPQMRQIAEPIRDELYRLFPEHFQEVNHEA